MKTKLFFIAAIVFMLLPDTASAQYYGSSTGGVDRSIGREVRGNGPRNKNKKATNDFGEVWAKYLGQELNLDGLQYAGVKSIMNENRESLEQISKDETLHPQEKKNKMLEIMNKIDIQILKFLSKEQGEKYTKLKEERERRAMTQ
ncbi:hypothetical protein GGR22_000516 [Flavobacterium gossypii]|uniref:LTXXQ motif family protein n=2 Tax=Flavobacterium TaxID=237 RepID=A0A495MHJ5_9FLAO|nr:MULTISPECIES: hypothetical protein [Flavobacterium]MBA9072390.1 hypothetical protein [Flavobacterium gossypii]RKS25436.1 hypothetical protein CLV94_0468 [Flavobacterium endophyticum]